MVKSGPVMYYEYLVLISPNLILIQDSVELKNANKLLLRLCWGSTLALASVI